MRNILSKFINTVKSHRYDIFLGSCIDLISIISYNLGQINSLKKTPITIKENNGQKTEIYSATIKKGVKSQNIQNAKYSPAERVRNLQDTKSDTRVVVSKNSDKYHYSNCSGSKRIKPENQIWFNSAQEAEKAGYTLAGNCAK